LVKRSSGMVSSFVDDLTDQRAARGSPSCLSSIDRINGLVIRVVLVEIPSRISLRPAAMAMIVGRLGESSRKAYR
jgi:hypothetical protein